MRIEMALATPDGATVDLAPPRRRIDLFETGLLLAFAAISVWVLALDLWQVIDHGKVWTGTDGFFVIDQLQYVAWIRDASHHFLASNLFVLRPTAADYFQPAVAISGLLSALGVAPWLSLLLWKPVAVGGMFYAVRSYVYRSFIGRGERRAAFALALFFGSFSIVYGSFSVVGDLFPGFLSWGYTFGLMAIAAMLGSLVTYARVHARGARTRLLSWAPGLLGALASALHPWQGEVLLLIIAGTELLHRRSWARLRADVGLPVRTIGLTALPLVYYLILGHADLSWSLAREASKHSFSFWTIALALAPLALPAALGYRAPARSFLDSATRIWPLAAILVYAMSATALGATPLHAFEGITVPLGVLAVAGVRHSPLRKLPAPRLLTIAAIAALTIPANVYQLSIAHKFMSPTDGNANFIRSEEHHALQYLARDRQKGGVLTRFYLGSVVPAQTGRRTFVGNCLWSEPRCSPRAQLAQQLFDGLLAPRTARRFVRHSGARFVLADCDARTDLSRTLRPLLVSVRRFGCATVYEVDAPSAPTGPLAESRAYAAVRPARRQ